ncbi:MAG: serine hydrolase, partial [Pyrinomonadaceae bacterium]
MLRRPKLAVQALLVTLVLLLPYLSLVAQTQTTAARLKEIDRYAAKTRHDWNVPGFAVAIVKDDKVVFAKGYGLRDLGKPESVDENTLFAIASNTKAFTSAALAMLVDEGKVKWDDPVTRLDGMTSQVAMLPEERLGVVVLTNSETPLSNIMVNKVFDEFLAVPQRDWSRDFLTRASQSGAAQRTAAKKLEDSRVPHTKTSLQLSAYAGTYTGAMYGDAKVSVENGKL